MRAHTTGAISHKALYPLGKGPWLLCSLLPLALGACVDLTDLDTELGDPCSSAVSITLGRSMSGQLTLDDCVQADGAYGDRWSLDLSSRTSIVINVTSPLFDGVLELHDSTGNLIGYGDDFIGPTNARITESLPAGSYVITVRSIRAGAIGQYELSVGLAADCGPLGDLTLGVPVTGTLAASDCLSEWDSFMDHWSLTLTSTQKLRLDVQSTDFDEIILIRDERGDIIESSDWGGPTGSARLETELAAGNWTISVTAPDEGFRGDYDLTVDIAPPCTPGKELVLGETVRGEIAPTDCLMDGWMPADSFGLTIDQETPIDIRVKSTDLDPLLILQDQNGRDIAVGWSVLQDGIAQIHMSLAPGSYSLFVTAGSDPPEGSYQLTVTESVCADPLPIALGESVEGSLDATDCLRAGGAYQDSWRLVLPNDITVRIDLESDDFDAFLVLQDSVGDTIETNDDGGVGFNSRIDRLLTAGTYEIRASSFGEGQIGAYRLTVAAPPAPMTAAMTTETPTGSRAKVAAESGSPSELLSRIRLEYQAGRKEASRWHDDEIPRF